MMEELRKREGWGARIGALALYGLLLFDAAARSPESKGATSKEEPGLVPRKRFGIGSIPGLFKQAFKETDFSQLMRRSAALAFYAALSLAPLLIVALAVASLLWSRDDIRASLVAEMRSLVGPSGGDLIATILDHNRDKGEGIFAAVAGGVTLLIGATAVFVELQDGLNAIWGITKTKGRGLFHFIRVRLLSVAMVISFGFLLLVSLVASTALTALTKSLHLEEFAIVGIVVHFLVSVLGTSLLFAALFKFLPDAKVRWRDVAVGAVTTAIIFNLGQIAIGAYLGSSSVGSAYGAAGSLVLILVWVEYSAAIVFFGAQLTESYARTFGGGVLKLPARS
jgi:membrane protein